MAIISINVESSRDLFETTITAMHNNDSEFKQLKFYNCNAEDIIKIAAALKNNKSVNEIDLSENQIGDEGAEAIAAALEINRSVTKINLFLSQIGDEGAKAIAAAIKDNTSVTKIDLCSNKIGDEGAKAIAEALKINKSVTEIDLSGNKFGDEGAIAIAAALESNTSVTKINLSGNLLADKVAKAIAEALKINKSVTKIHLSYNQIGDTGAEAIAAALESNKSVAEINLSGNKIGDTGAEAIAAALESNKSVTEINLNQNRISDKGAKAIAAALKNNKSVTKIQLRENPIGDEGAEAIAAALKNNKSVTKIQLSENQISDEGAKAIAAALKTNSSVTEINLSKNQIGDTGAKAIAAALKNNKSVTKIQLSENQIGDEGAEAIAAALESNKSVIRIYLDKNQISNEMKISINKLILRNIKFFERAKKDFLSHKHLDDEQEQVLIANIDSYDELFKEKVVGSILSKGIDSPETVNIEIDKFISKAELEPNKIVKTAQVSDAEFNIPSSINKLAVGAYAIKESIESLPIVTSFFKIYDIDISWLHNFSQEIHLTASYVGSLALGEIDPSAALFSNSLYKIKQEIRENLYQSYNHDLHKTISNPVEFAYKCGNYIVDQTVLNLANGDFANLNTISLVSSSMVSAVECYSIYNNHNEASNNNGYLKEFSKYAIYPAALVGSFESMDFSNNFNAMQSCKQGISTLASVVALDQLFGMISPMIED